MGASKKHSARSARRATHAELSKTPTKLAEGPFLGFLLTAYQSPLSLPTLAFNTFADM